MNTSYNVRWNTQSKDSGESMPLGGHDLGCNVWVEQNELLLYIAQSGAFDETGKMLKAGRVRISFDRNIFKDSFSQELRLQQGDILIEGSCDGEKTTVELWVDTKQSVVHIELISEEEVHITVRYENWRDELIEQSIAVENNQGTVLTKEYKDVIEPNEGAILFYHRNALTPMLDSRLKEQGIEHLKAYYPDVEKNRTSGGIIIAEGMSYNGTNRSKYMQNEYIAYELKTKQPVHKQNIEVYLHTAQTDSVESFKSQLMKEVSNSLERSVAKSNTINWWKEYWNRSYVHIKAQNPCEQDIDWQVGRNYQLFRYMLASNAYGEFPTKFNGGLFTIDACVWSRLIEGRSPDWRDWGGIMFTAQNQRLVYWPMIKNGDFDMMKPEFDFYKRLVTCMKKRTEHFFGIKDAACYCEQIDANGLSSHYGNYGVDYPLQVRHHYVEALEFVNMMLTYHEVCEGDISEYMEFILSVLNFYDYKYCNLDERGKRIIFPSTAMETYHGEPLTQVYGEAGREAANYNEEETAVTNPADVIAALEDSLDKLLATTYLTKEQQERLHKLREELPPIPTEVKKGHLVIAPCELPKKYYKGNCEIPQLNTVHPYNSYGINKPELELARNTYYYGWDEKDQLDHVSWHPVGIYAARLGLIEEAHKYMRLKLGDSGRRFPAFWGPGHDYTPDHNWGGSGMLGVQEMLLQNFEHKIYLLPSWPKELDVDFKLWADHKTYVEVQYHNQVLTYQVTPKEREKDIIVC